MKTWGLLDQMLYFVMMMLSKWLFFLLLLLLLLIINYLNPNGCFSFDMQLSNFGLDVNELKKQLSTGFMCLVGVLIVWQRLAFWRNIRIWFMT